MAETPCPICNNQRHYRTQKGWARCDCFWDALAVSGFIKAPLRLPGETKLPAEYHQIPCWPLEDKLVEGGDFDDFRFTAWRSLLELYDSGVSYFSLDGCRAVDMYFGRDPDPEYPTLQALVDWQLVILILGVTDVLTNPLYPHAVWRARKVRQFAGKPTWVYAKYGFPRLGERAASLATIPSTPAIAPAPSSQPSLAESAIRSLGFQLKGSE